MTALPLWLGPFILGLFGLLIGSFANVVIYRLPRGESLSQPPSHCPACGHPVRWHDNIPVVSWILLRRRCRDCSTSISVRYPLVEVAMGLLWAGVGLLYGMDLRVAPGIILVSLLLILSLIDLDTMRLPNVLVGILFVAGLLFAAISQISSLGFLPLLPAPESGLLSHPLAFCLLGTALGAGLSLGIAWMYASVRKAEGFGMGDVKLLGAVGIFVGPYVLMVLFAASLIGAIWAGISGRVESLRSKMPFGPFIAIATLLVLLFGSQFWSWYAGLIRIG